MISMAKDGYNKNIGLRYWILKYGSYRVKDGFTHGLPIMIIITITSVQMLYIGNVTLW